MTENMYTMSMPNFFVVKNDTIEYKFDNVLYCICVIKAGSRNQSMTQMIESGLNHWLDYWYHTDETIYNRVCEELFKNYINIQNYIFGLIEKDKSIYGGRQEMIDKYCYPSEFIGNAIIHYVLDLTVCSINEDDASTDVTITNAMATVITIASFYFKYLELFSEMNPEKNLKEDSEHDRYIIFEKSLSLCIKALLSFKTTDEHIQHQIFEIFEVESMDDLDEKELKNSVYDFISERAGVLWDKNSSTSFDEKYLEVGYDSNWNEGLAIGSAFGACKKYCAPLISDDLIPKYATKARYQDIDKPLKASKFHYHIGEEYTDFAFVTKNVAGYFQGVLGNTNSTTSTKKTLPNINVTTILNADSEAIRKQEAALLEDDKMALYDMRVETCENLFRDIIKELASTSKRFNISNPLEFSNEFSLEKSHKLNAYILAKIFLSLTGEREIYRDIYGVYSKLFLCLFYIRIANNNKYEEFRNIAECMRMFPSVITGDAHKDVVDEFLESHMLNKDLSVPFQNICRGYADPSRDLNGFIDIPDFYNFFEFMKDPYNVRHIMLPNQYKDIKPVEVIRENPHKDVIEACLRHIL
jgi:hypothetical protein